jgi:protein-tyrosine-phosphatase
MKKYDRLLFIDEDDTARAPMAAAIMRQKDLLLPMAIGSRGIVVLFPEPVNQKAEAILVSHGLTAGKHAAAPLTEEEAGGGSLLLTMEESQRDRIREKYPEAKHVYTLSEYTGQEGDTGALYGEPLVSYGKCFETLDKMAESLADRLNREVLEK